MKYLVIGLIIMTLAFLNSCAGPNIKNYADVTPTLNLESFFDGELVAYGMVRDRSGKVIRHFEAIINASWDSSGVGVLDETFWFSDGEIQKRIWTIKPIKGGIYQGTASDVLGEADIKLAGNAMNIRYQLSVPWKDGTINVSMDDWLYQVSPSVLMNETAMTKWGFSVGTVTLVIMKKSVVNDIPVLLAR